MCVALVVADADVVVALYTPCDTCVPYGRPDRDGNV